MSLNTWGMPYSLGSYDKELRMAAIGQYINQSEHDIYLLQVYNPLCIISVLCVNSTHYIFMLSTHFKQTIPTLVGFRIIFFLDF